MNKSLVRWTKDPATSTGKHSNVIDAVLEKREQGFWFELIGLPHVLSDSITTVSPQRTEPMEQTSSGPQVDFQALYGQSSGAAVLEIRRRSGLTWEQLSELFNVSRRSIHYWANGKPLSSQHEKNVRNTLLAIRHVDTGNQRDTRSRLLSIDDGESIFDLLANQKYKDVYRIIVGTASDIASRNRISLSKDEWNRRSPPRPEMLLDALQDRPKISPNKARAVRPKRRNRSSE